jgi:predicted transposase/invertase (TIGR01784 family)
MRRSAYSRGKPPVERLDPKLDIVFKLLLTREPRLLADMLGGILAKRVGKPKVLNAGILGEQARDKQAILDVRVSLRDGSRADVEMQNRKTPALASRLVYYGARDYAGQLVRGESYELLRPTAVIVWLAEPLFPELERLHSIFELRDRHTPTVLSGQLAVHVLQLSSLSPSRPTGYDGRVERWARFLTARDDTELRQLASENRIMSLAKQTLDQLSQDPEARRLAREREDAIKLYRMELVASKAEGKAELLIKLLGLRFGPPSAATRARVEAASPKQLDAWAERVLTAKTLDEVLAPTSSRSRSRAATRRR